MQQAITGDEYHHLQLMEPEKVSFLHYYVATILLLIFGHL